MGLEADIKKLEDSLKQKYIQNDDKLKEIIEKKLKAKKEELAKQKKAPVKKEASKKQPETKVKKLAETKPKLVREIARFSSGWLRVVLLEYKNQPKGKYLVQRINTRLGEQDNYHYALAISAGKKVLDLIKGQEKIEEGTFTTWLSELPSKAVTEIVEYGDKLGIKFPMGVRPSKRSSEKRPTIVNDLEEYVFSRYGEGVTFYFNSPNIIEVSADEGAKTRNIGGHFKDFGEVSYEEELRKVGKGDDEFYLTLKISDKFLKQPVKKVESKKSESKKLEFNKAEQSILDQLKIPADHPYKKAKVGSEDWILEGKKILSDLKKKLPDNKSDYFKKVEGSIIIPIADIQPVKKYEKGNKSLLNAKFFMTLAKDGEIARRKPIEVEALNRGKFLIVDGNATWHVAKQEGWKEIPAIVTTKVKKEVDGEEFDCDELIQEKIESKRKAKKAREERSKKRESVKNVERIEKASDLIEESIEIRLEKGKTLSKAEVEKLIKETEDLLKKLKQIFKTL